MAAFDGRNFVRAKMDEQAKGYPRILVGPDNKMPFLLNGIFARVRSRNGEKPPLGSSIIHIRTRNIRIRNQLANLINFWLD